MQAVDPFMQGHEPPTRRPGDFTRSTRGTPYVSDPTGRLVKPKRKSDPPRIATTPYSRPSGFSKIIQDMYSIDKWNQRQEAYGFAVDPTLVERAAILIEIEDRESDQWKDEADKIVKAAKIAAKASLAADRGTHAHELTEDDDEGRDIITRIETGEEMGLTPDVQHALVDAWRAMLERDQLEILAVEMPVVNDTYRGAGTLDRVGRLLAPLRFRLITGEIVELPAGWVGILDVKSGKRRLNPDGTVMYWHGYAVQVFLYASGVPYDTETDTRGEWEYPIDQRWALIAHLDVLGAIDGNPSCDLVLVDLEAGRRAADLCVAAKAWSNESTVFSVAQIVEGVDGAPATEHEGLTPSTPCKTCGGTGMVTVGDGDYEGAGCHDEPCPNCDPSSAGAPEPSAPLTVGEEAGAAAGHSPASSRAVLTTADRLTIEPDRLALVDARGQLATTPDQGADLSGAEHGEQWAALQRHYNDLDTAARSWLAELIGEATRRGVDFHARRARTLRVFELYRALITLCAADGGTDELLRALLALIVGDVALFPAIHPGHVVGSLSAAEATRFATLVDHFNGPGLAAYIDDDGLFRLRAFAA